MADYAFIFDIETDYKTTLDERVTILEEEAKETTRDERIALIDVILNDYVEQTGERPDAHALFRLSNVILNEELTDRHPDKVTRNERPFLSEGQFEIRERREQARSNWNINRDIAVGSRASFYRDDNGTMREAKQTIYKRN